VPLVMRRCGVPPNGSARYCAARGDTPYRVSGTG
jgi:hypothetical protein